MGYVSLQEGKPFLCTAFRRPFFFINLWGFLGSDQIGVGGIVGNAKVGLNLTLGAKQNLTKDGLKPPTSNRVETELPYQIQIMIGLKCLLWF